MGQVINLEDLRGNTVLLSFFRYASCPLCNLRVHELIRNHDELVANNVTVLAIFQSPAERIAHYVGRQTTPFPLICDPKMKLYRLFGVESSWTGFFRAWSIGLPRVMLAVLGKGFLPGTIEGDLNRIPADFIIDPKGTLIDAYYGIDIGDHMPLHRVFDKLKGRDLLQST